MLNLSIKLKLLVTILIVTLLPLMTAGYFSYESSYKGVYGVTKQDLNYIVHLETEVLGEATSNMEISSEDDQNIKEALLDLKTEYFEKNEMEGYGYILDEKGVILYHPDQTVIGDNLSDQSFAQKILNEESGYIEYDWKGETKVAAFDKLPNGWSFAVSSYLDDMMKPVEPIKQEVLIISIIGSIVAMMVGGFIITQITKPIKSVVAAMEKAESGDLTVEVPVYFEDEIGQISVMYNKMMGKLKSILISIHEASEQVAASSQQLTAAAEENSKASEQISSAAEEISRGSQEQVDSVAQVVSSIHTISHSIDLTATNVKKVNEDSRIADQFAKEGVENLNKVVFEMNDITKKVSNTEHVIRELGQQSAAIMGIITIIRDISEQTNLLALNAAIEAARAGEQGKSFAVVAGEVRKLAEQSGKSANEIAELIVTINDEIKQATVMMEESSKAVSEGETVVQEASGSFVKIKDAVLDVHLEMEVLAEAIVDIKENASVIVGNADSISRLAEVAAGDTEEVAAAAEEQNASMQEINSSSHMLAQMAEYLQSQVSHFKVK
ncbi:methyl-accepting chemotaxis protein [Cytobacillus spongiae]|uniref:methyl-accepting chemotaxis protein n=1 Tax=Cytobacillus spongiae TaxID=2901381 RepID=UPI001F451C03|nr:methyl-accepting chemotaxis protein [Cytobacillus spongiae]UII57848.1 methyl-accepting chemotaxis protein [Cytobacillus spongiae]